MAIGVNVFTGVTTLVGFLHIAPGGLRCPNSDTMSVGPWLLVCLSRADDALCSLAWAGWLTGLTGVGHVTVKPCWASCSVDSLQSEVLRLG